MVKRKREREREKMEETEIRRSRCYEARLVKRSRQRSKSIENTEPLRVFFLLAMLKFSLA